MRDFQLPDVGEGLAEAELLGWLVEVGDLVAEGQPIAEVSTDKVNVEIPSPCDGTIRELPWRPDDVVPVGAVLARIEPAAPGSGVGQVVTAPATSTPGGEVAARHVVAAPSTRRLAHERGIDLRTVRGSGPAGRILRADLDRTEQPAPAGATAPAAQDAPARRTADGQAWEALPLSGVRLTSAKRLEHSARTYAAATSTFTAAGDGLVRLRQSLRSDVQHEQVGTLALMIKAVAAALVRNPRFNARIDEERRTLLIGSRVDLAVAVATDHGLTVPVLRDARGTSAARVHAAVRDLSDRAHAQRLTPADMDGATFTLSSTGAMEQARVVSTTPVINPPQVATLWLSRVADAPRVVDGRLEAGPVVTGSLTFDHRFIDGAEATQMLNDLTLFLEQPERALV